VTRTLLPLLLVLAGGRCPKAPPEIRCGGLAFGRARVPLLLGGRVPVAASTCGAARRFVEHEEGA